jgi:hypothetical protein
MPGLMDRRPVQIRLMEIESIEIKFAAERNFSRRCILCRIGAQASVRIGAEARLGNRNTYMARALLSDFNMTVHKGPGAHLAILECPETRRG